MTAQSSQSWLRALERTADIARNPLVTLPAAVERLAAQFGEAEALVSRTDRLSYRALQERIAHYARWALAQGLVPGDTVCLFKANCPEYPAIWLGISSIGGIVALLNTNLRGAALAHAISTVSPRHVIVGSELHAAFSGARNNLGPDIACWSHGGDGADMDRIDRDGAAPGAPLDMAKRNPPNIRDTALYIYTSGTTGLPKAAAVSHFRLMQWSHWFAGMMDTGPGDRMYNCLPMYHSVGGVVAVGATLVGGGAVVVREKFSAREFWSDVAESGCSLFQYVGEMCRYLTRSPPGPHETDHRIRLCSGNGLSAGVWQEFQQRFRIPRILEFYASTEGNVTLYNCEGKPGAIGRIPPFLAQRFAIELVKCDPESGEPLRGDDGFCRRCEAGEIGHAIGRISDAAQTLGGRFEGYTDRAASQKKILRDAFAKADAWYLTGDLMTKDRSRYYYFVDRVGDTFRWKGENVSTAEVADVLGACEGVVEAVVYGVRVPGAEGRAGMAAMVVDGGFDLSRFAQALPVKLASYARPQFLRICDAIDLTGTFKPQKERFKRQGFDLAAIRDPLYFWDRTLETYVPLDAALHRRIQAGEALL